MSQNPRNWPGSSNETPSWTDNAGRPSDHATGFFSNEPPKDVSEVARTLAVHVGGPVSVGLAFDLVLHDVVEKAQNATGASGAAIALFRDGELVCRATTGDSAPDLGVRVDTTSGLAGSCLVTGQMQQCRDTDTDPRVNAEACRRLGVRSMLIAPLIDQQEVFGILQVFSAWPNSFGEREVATLQVLAQRISENKRQAEVTAAMPPGVEEEPHPPVPAISDNLLPRNDQPSAYEADDISALPAEEPRGSDAWTTVLAVLVIVVAVLLGVAVGWHSALKGSMGAPQTAAASPAPSEQNSQGSSAAQPETPTALPGTTAPPKEATAANAKAASPVSPPPSGALVVTENGRVIYRSLPDAAAPKTPAQHSGTRLIHRIEPEYPAQAKVQNIQGPVVLDVQIEGNGSVGKIDVISGDPLLADAAVVAVRQWRYEPYYVEGRPVQSETRITIRFTLPPG